MGASASREKFRESVNALIEVDVSPDDAEFWDELWKIPSSSDEVFELITPEAARQLRDERFDNLATLFTQATAQLCQIVETPYNIYFDQALNCVRVLTRILPFLLERGDLSADEDELIEQLCWGTGSAAVEEEEEEDDDDDADGDTSDGDSSVEREAKKKKKKKKSKKKKDREEEEQEPLALLVVHAAMHMMFLPQFTCDFYEEEVTDDKPSRKSKGKGDEEDPEDKDMRAEAGLGNTRICPNGVSLLPRPTSIVWAAGCGVTPDTAGYEGSTRKYDKNRIEVLRLLLSTCCDPLFSAADEYNPLSSRWLAIAVAADSPNASCLFYSLMNTVMSYDPSGMSIPYSATLGPDNHIKLVELSLQVLICLLDCGLPGNPEAVVNDDNQAVVEFNEASRGGFNVFRTLLARIHTRRELTFIYKGFARLLKNVYESKGGYLPTNSKPIECYQELMVLLWKLLEENPLFMTHILTQMDVNEIVVPICFLMFQSRRDPSKIGLVHICTFILLKLSGERSFGVNLNKPFTIRLPCDIPLFSGSHADLVAITLHKLIVNGAYKLVPLYSCFITVICNLSPYWRSMSLVAAVKLVNLFELFSSPKFLYSSEHAHKHLALLLEVFNNVVQYQYTGNQHLVYALIRRKDSFGRLAALTLQKAIAQCEKAYGSEIKFAKNGGSLTHDPDTVTKSSTKKSKGKKKKKKDESMDSDDDSDSDNDSDKNDEESSEEEDEEETYQHNNDASYFLPTEKWMAELKATLPMETVTRLLQHLIPVVDELCSQKNGVVDEVEILEVLKDVTMVGLLPVPHAIVIRKYQPNQYTSLWFTAYMWGVIFLRSQAPPMFDGESIQLFQVSNTGDR